MRELKPCPFCGSDDLKVWATSIPYQSFVECRKCCCIGPDCVTTDEAIAAWNRRAPQLMPGLVRIDPTEYQDGLYLNPVTGAVIRVTAGAHLK